MTSQVIVIALVLLVAVCSSTEIHKCKKGTLPLSVRVDGCDKQPCKFHAGQNTTIEVDFVLEQPTKTATPEVHVEVFGVSNKVELPDDLKDACKNLVVGTCPIEAGVQHTYRMTIPIEHSWVSPFMATLRLGLLDDSHDTVLCFRADVKVLKD